MANVHAYKDFHVGMDIKEKTTLVNIFPSFIMSTKQHSIKDM